MDFFQRQISFCHLKMSRHIPPQSEEFQKGEEIPLGKAQKLSMLKMMTKKNPSWEAKRMMLVVSLIPSS